MTVFPTFKKPVTVQDFGCQRWKSTNSAINGEELRNVGVGDTDESSKPVHRELT